MVIDPSQSIAFPMNVIALLPYMLLNYEDANGLCIRAAENIAQVNGKSRTSSLWVNILFLGQYWKE